MFVALQPNNFRLPNGSVVPSGNLTATGFDIDTLLLLFGSVLNIPVAFKYYDNYLELYFALRNRECDMVRRPARTTRFASHLQPLARCPLLRAAARRRSQAATGIEQDSKRAHCVRSCPPAPIFIDDQLDYGARGV